MSEESKETWEYWRFRPHPWHGLSAGWQARGRKEGEPKESFAANPANPANG
jgi:hypothetical protein